MVPKACGVCALVEETLKDRPVPTISAEDQAQVNLYRSLLYSTRLETDPATNKRRLVTAPTPISRAYVAGKRAYEAAEQRYSALYQTARPNSDSQILLDFASAMQIALTNWIIKGYKNDVEEMEAFIAQVTEPALGQPGPASRPER